MGMKIDSIIFDIGHVLIDSSPSHLYDRIFQDKEKKEFFLQRVSTPEWYALQNSGKSAEEATEEIARENPGLEHMIRAFYARWKEMFQGPIEGSVQILRELKSKRFRL